MIIMNQQLVPSQLLIDSKASPYVYINSFRKQVLEARVAILQDTLQLAAQSATATDPVERVKARADAAISARYKWVRATSQRL
jgi:negative regulator of replication initiation